MNGSHVSHWISRQNVSRRMILNLISVSMHTRRAEKIREHIFFRNENWFHDFFVRQRWRREGQRRQTILQIFIHIFSKWSYNLFLRAFWFMHSNNIRKFVAMRPILFRTSISYQFRVQIIPLVQCYLRLFRSLSFYSERNAENKNKIIIKKKYLVELNAKRSEANKAFLQMK